MPILLIFLKTFFFISNVAALGITAQPAAIVGQASLVFWSLQPSDGSNPLIFDLRFVRPGPEAKDVGLAVANIHASPLIPYGTAQIVFPSSGPCELVAVSGPESTNLGRSNQVNVIRTTSQLIPFATTTAHPTGIASGVHHKKNLGAIIGGTLGGVAFLGILIALVIFFLRRRRRRSTSNSNRRWTFHRDRMVRPANINVNAGVNPTSPTTNTQPSCTQDIEHGLPENTDPSEVVMIASPNGPRPLLKLKYRPLPLPPAPLTERQGAVVKRMEEVRDQMMELERNAGPTQHIMLDDMQKQMRWLEGQVGSEWAMGLTDVTPLGFAHNLAP